MGLGPAADHSSAVESVSRQRTSISNREDSSDWTNIIEHLTGSNGLNLSDEAWIDLDVERTDEPQDSTRGAAVDIICVKRNDGSLACSNFAVKFPTSSGPRIYDSVTSMASRWRRSYAQATRRRRILQQRRTNFSDDEANEETDDVEIESSEKRNEEPFIDIFVNGKKIAAVMRLCDDGYCRFSAPAWQARAKKNLLLSQAGYEENANLPSDKELAAMQLCPGRNSIRFETIRRGKHLIAEARIFLWKQNDGIVICDIDGTVTRTDIRGFVDSVVNETPTNAHAGVCDFLDQVASRAHVLYLTSRPLVLADATRFFLDNLKQSALSAGRGIGARAARMPQGPLIMARSNLTSALYSELVLKNPHEFKTWALHDILAAFVPTTKDEDQLVMPMPFKAGFGNKHTDCRAYQTAGIPNHAIFLIGTDSVLRLPYLHLHDTGGLRNTLSAHNFDQFNHDEQISSLDSNNSPVFEGYTDPHLRHRVFQILGAPPIPRPLLRPPSIRSTSV